MKTVYYIIVIFLTIVLCERIKAQNCESCRNNDYPFIGCCKPNFDECKKCTNDPLNQGDDFKPFKKCKIG